MGRSLTDAERCLVATLNDRRAQRFQAAREGTYDFAKDFLRIVPRMSARGHLIYIFGPPYKQVVAEIDGEYHCYKVHFRMRRAVLRYIMSLYPGEWVHTRRDIPRRLSWFEQLTSEAKRWRAGKCTRQKRAARKRLLAGGQVQGGNVQDAIYAVAPSTADEPSHTTQPTTSPHGE